MKTKIVSSIAMIIVWPFSLYANTVPPSVGLGVSWSQSQYKGYGHVYNPLPNLTFDNDTFYIDNFTAGLYLYNDDVHEVSFALSYLPFDFKPSHSNDWQMKQLDKRRATLLAQMEYTLSTQIGNFSTNIAVDVLDESHSVLINASYTTLLSFDKLSIVPEIGFNWANSQHNNYYYGVSEKESKRSGLAVYSMKGSFTPYISLTSYYSVTQNMLTYLGTRVDRLMAGVKDSPMIEHSNIPSLFAGISYTF